MKSGVPTESEGWKLDNCTYGSQVCTHYHQGREEAVTKNVVDGDDMDKVMEGYGDDLPTYCMSCMIIY